jgi:hypothetical protein
LVTKKKKKVTIRGLPHIANLRHPEKLYTSIVVSILRKTVDAITRRRHVGDGKNICPRYYRKPTELERKKKWCKPTNKINY